MLPDLSAFFGVTIDELFALSDDTRMERIQNMIWDVRFYDPADVEKEQQFLLEKGRREPDNDKVFQLLADMENHLANQHHIRAAEYAKEALSRNPENPVAHAELIDGMRGRMDDWYVTNHHELIICYQEFVKKHPEVKRGYMWLIEHLLYAGRTAEAKEYLESFLKLDDTYRSLYYKGLVFNYEGKQDQAYACWQEMMENYPNDWHVWLKMGNIAARNCQYEQAKSYFRKALDVQPLPHFCDPFESIAQICELQGDIHGAIDAYREELDVMKNEYKLVTGETVDFVTRQISRLEESLN